MEQAESLAESGEYEEAWRVLNTILDDDFDNAKALFILGFVFIKMDRIGLAYQVLKRSAEIAPHIAATWGNLGKCFLDMRKQQEAEQCFRRQLKLDPDSIMALNNLGLINQQNAEVGLALEYFKRVLKIDPDQLDAKINTGFSSLALYKWKEGWEGYNLNIGQISDRKERHYGDEPRWDGSKGKKVLVYGEQGLGDEISFSSCIPDLIRDSKNVVFDCDKRLEGAYRRSFPTAKIYGTRYKEEPQDWYQKEDFDSRVAVGALPQFYRNSDEEFPGKPFLIPDPEMSIQWKALLDSLGSKPKIGIAWSGGRPHT
jgi:tetratricopeptide (TPR) repeat protein